MQQIGLLLLAGLVWASSALNATCTPQEQQLVEFVGKVGPNPYEKVSAEQCHDELHTFFKGIQDYAESHDLHGHWIREMHSKQWAEAFEYQLFIEGVPFGPGTLGADLFSMSQPVKMLWSGVDPATRDAWKKSLKAGELAKETKAGQSLEKAGQCLAGSVQLCCVVRIICDMCLVPVF